MKVIEVDGSYGEGGGQILRTALALSAIRGIPVRIRRIRARRRNPGLAAQHLATVRACAEIVDAKLEGASLGSTELLFHPRRPPRCGRYAFDIGTARQGGSAGSATLLLQTVLLVLAFADGPSEVEVRGGTHVPWSPPFDYLQSVWAEALRAMGLVLELELVRPGWYPAGGGRVRARVAGAAQLAPLERTRRGRLRSVRGYALSSKLPSHVLDRMARTCSEILAPLGVPVRIERQRLDASSPGAALTLVAQYDGGRAGFGALAERGLPAEEVARSACTELFAFHATEAAVDPHLADQLLLPCALATGPSRYTTSQRTSHLATNAWLLEQLGVATVAIAATGSGTCEVRVEPT